MSFLLVIHVCFLGLVRDLKTVSRTRQPDSYTFNSGFIMYTLPRTDADNAVPSREVVIRRIVHSQLNFFLAILDGIISNGYQLVTSVTAAPKPVTDQTLINLQVCYEFRKALQNYRFLFHLHRFFVLLNLARYLILFSGISPRQNFDPRRRVRASDHRRCGSLRRVGGLALAGLWRRLQRQRGFHTPRARPRVEPSLQGVIFVLNDAGHAG